MKAEAFIIHLARARERAPQVERLRKDLPLPTFVIEAVDAADLAEGKIASIYRPGLYRPRYPFALRRSEIACFLSHRKAWQAIVDQKLDAGLVIEDDVALDPQHFGPLLELVLVQARSDEFVRFSKDSPEKGREVAHSSIGRLVTPFYPGLGMQAQLIGREAAARLLSFTETFDRPVDTLIQMHWLHNVRVLSARPVAIREVASELGGTTVQGETKSLAETLWREFNRARYRLSAKTLNALMPRSNPR